MEKVRLESILEERGRMSYQSLLLLGEEGAGKRVLV